MLETAIAAGVSPETLRKVETGRIATPSFATVAAIAGVLGLSLDALWAEVNGSETHGAAARDGAPDTAGSRPRDRLSS